MPFEIIRDDITHVKADAIVNTANPDPVVGAGTDSAIHTAAGPRLLDARKRIGRIAVGTSQKTRAYDLPAKYVLHTVSPAWIDGTHGEEALLKNAYDAALTLADRLKCRSIAFPLLSAGCYGFPEDRALSIAIRAFTDFLMTHDLRIILVLFGEGSFSLAKGLFGDLRAYIDDHYVDAAKKAEYGSAPGIRIRTRREAAAGARFEPAQLMAEIRESSETGSDQAMHAIEAENADASEPMLNLKRPQAAFMADAAPMAKPASNRSRKAKAVFAPQEANGLEELLKKAESTFSEYLLDLLNECGEKDSDVYHRAEISRQLFNKIINRKDYQPTKSTAIQLALGLRLDLAKTQKLLSKAGYALTRSSKTDLVVQYFIERGEYSIVTVNTALYDCGLPLLKTGSAL